MKISCNIADDLLPLYIDGSCSEESRAVLEEHLNECSICQEKLDRMQNDDCIQEIQIKPHEPQLTNYAKKVKRHRIRAVMLGICITIISAVLLSLCYLTVKDMKNQANPAVHSVEEGVYNLTAADLETTANEVEQYVLYINNEQISITVDKEEGSQCTIKLWNTENTEDFILIHELAANENTCVFTGLSAANRYIVTCDGPGEIPVTVSEGRIVDFWSSLKSVVSEMIGIA